MLHFASHSGRSVQIDFLHHLASRPAHLFADFRLLPLFHPSSAVLSRNKSVESRAWSAAMSALACIDRGFSPLSFEIDWYHDYPHTQPNSPRSEERRVGNE